MNTEQNPQDSISLTSDGEFTIGLSHAKLKDITENKMRDIDLGMPKEAYESLSDANKRALVHLVKAAQILDDVYLKQDHPDNIRIKEAFKRAAGKGNETIDMAYQLFQVFNGIEGPDPYSPEPRKLRVLSDKKLQNGRGFYPQDLDAQELIDYVLEHPEQASAIFSNNTMVQRDGDRLVAVPYSVVFRDEMESAARELLEAATKTDHQGLSDYLSLQAQALVNDSDPEMGYRADKTWINLKDSPLDFMIGRESYKDRMSPVIISDNQVEAMLSKYGIKAKSKDDFGVRVGIVNQESAAAFDQYVGQLEAFNQYMIDKGVFPDDVPEELKISMVDVDLVYSSGSYKQDRSGITIANTLPNPDKLAVQLGEGNRIGGARQVRERLEDPELVKALFTSLLHEEQMDWHGGHAFFQFLAGHELGHSLGPKMYENDPDGPGSLGKWGAILEENKADLLSVCMAVYLVEVGEFTQQQANEVHLTWVCHQLPNKKPKDDEAHRFRSLMQINYFRENGAIVFESGGKLSIVPEKMFGAAQNMLNEIVQIRLAGDALQAEAFVKKYAAWNDALQYAVDERLKLKPRDYRLIDQSSTFELLGLTPDF